MIFSESKKSCSVYGWMGIAFLFWCWCFRHFLSGEVAFTSDAVSYYNHIKFFIDHMVQGIYPLWNPYFSDGVVNEFFLRRFGSFNPFYLIIMILRWCGMGHHGAYVSFLSLYWFIGACGFFVLARALVKDERSAFIGFLLLYFSAMGDRLFDSYILLVFIPMIWFFAFCVRFIQTQKLMYFVGIIFTLMILATTYIPLYFGVILTVLVILGMLIFPDQVVLCAQMKWQFFRKHWLPVILCLGALGGSLVPGLRMYQSSKAGQFVMPIRSHTTQDGHALSVGKKVVTSWAVLEEFVYARVFKDAERFKFAVLYVPCVAWIVFFLGLGVRCNRRIFFYVTALLIFLLMSTPGLTAFYSTLYAHIPLFKLFRNLHWFLWLAMIPISILLVTEMGDRFLDILKKEKTSRMVMSFWIGLVHAGCLSYLHFTQALHTMTLVSVFLSAGFWMYVCWKRSHVPGLFFIGAVFIIIVLEPLVIFSSLSANSVKKTDLFRYEQPYREDIFQKTGQRGQVQVRVPLYYAMSAYAEPYAHIDPAVFNYFTHIRFRLYDQAVFLSEHDPEFSWNRLEKIMKQPLNVAVAADHNRNGFLVRNPPRPGPEEIITDTTAFQVLRFEPNEIQLKTHYFRDRFLVLAQAFDPHWAVWVNGQKESLYRALGAFQGVVVPAGENLIHFKFSPGKWYGNIFLLLVFYSMFGWFVFLSCVERKKEVRDV